MTARVMILMVIAAAKAVWSILEQPGSSIMEFHPSFQKTLKILGLGKLRMKMAHFGGETNKPTILYSRSLNFVLVSRLLFGWRSRFTFCFLFGNWKPHN